MLSNCPDLPNFHWTTRFDKYKGTVGEPGITYERRKRVERLVYRGTNSRVVGILDYYPEKEPPQYTILVLPGHQKQGIGIAMLDEAVRRWGTSFVTQQNYYTQSGSRLTEAWLEKREKDGLV